jgi:hypothetical protein
MSINYLFLKRYSKRGGHGGFPYKAEFSLSTFYTHFSFPLKLFTNSVIIHSIWSYRGDRGAIGITLIGIYLQKNDFTF